ncbi:uncharacterized protein MYCFIDRAFT_178226 [Pseudocercospora fijiensis CIRAD86]|uniref:Uncharacterized protein n=1 Tax=Pseudocercospora fijiensis (strain CIRAD86) TaxID=383855 RepID=M3AQD1_PSEFD|nr:uncharacterized protein MYCFIDRAFT_178226 [Pseudocercospora fijiensis CIRAD86]EME79642.1 hypothetical protein MYCFIDRAFT_178226 [Pseudocercospora fijiensis CIRAD86]
MRRTATDALLVGRRALLERCSICCIGAWRWGDDDEDWDWPMVQRCAPPGTLMRESANCASAVPASVTACLLPPWGAADVAADRARNGVGGGDARRCDAMSGVGRADVRWRWSQNCAFSMRPGSGVEQGSTFLAPAHADAYDNNNNSYAHEHFRVAWGLCVLQRTEPGQTSPFSSPSQVCDNPAVSYRRRSTAHGDDGPPPLQFLEAHGPWPIAYL